MQNGEQYYVMLLKTVPNALHDEQYLIILTQKYTHTRNKNSVMKKHDLK